MTADIITIGDELLIGQTTDTNSAWIGEELSKNGIAVRQITSVSDNADHIVEALNSALQKSEIILLTGGLGPTKDDITKHTLCKYFNTSLEINQEVLARIESYFSAKGIEILEVNKQQAALPKSAIVLENKLGTASGMWFEKNGRIIVSMPGVPYEMKYIMSNGVIPKLITHFQPEEILHHTVLTQGLGESKIAEIIEEWESGLSAEEIRLAYLPSPGLVKLRLSTKGPTRIDLESKIARKVSELKKLLPDIIFGENKDSLQSVVGNLLKSTNQTVSTAESCTGGAISSAFTSVAGSSAYFKGGLVAYEDDAKINLLHISPNILQKHGAVSKEIAESMATNAAQIFKTEYALATTGLAGPDGDSSSNPVGTIWIAVYGPSGVKSSMFSFGSDRKRNILRTTRSGLEMLRRYILDETA